LAFARPKTAADDESVAENIFCSARFWSASEFNFPFRNATRVPAVVNPQNQLISCASQFGSRRFLNSLNRMAQRFATATHG